MSLRLLPARLLPAELPLLPLPHPARHLSLSLPSRARSPPSASSSSSSTARTYPSQETPRLTLNVSGNGYSRPSSSAGGATAANADGMDARAHVGPFPMGVGMDSVQRKGASRPWSELSFGSKRASYSCDSALPLQLCLEGRLLTALLLAAPPPARSLSSPPSPPRWPLPPASLPRRPELDRARRRRLGRPPLLRHRGERRQRALFAKQLDPGLWPGRRPARGQRRRASPPVPLALPPLLAVPSLTHPPSPGAQSPTAQALPDPALHLPPAARVDPNPASVQHAHVAPLAPLSHHARPAHGRRKARVRVRRRGAGGWGL